MKRKTKITDETSRDESWSGRRSDCTSHTHAHAAGWQTAAPD